MKSIHSLLAIALLSACAMTASAQHGESVAPEPASPALLEHFYREIQKWDTGLPTTPGASASMSQAMRESEFMTTRNQLRQIGVKAWPLSPRVADLLLRTERNQYNLAWILTDMTPESPATPETVAALTSKYQTANAADRLVALAQLGKTRHLAAVPLLRSAATADEPVVRLVAYIALAYAGNADPEAAAAALGAGLTDREKHARTGAVNSLRLLGVKAQSAAPALGEYLKTRDNVFQATAALKVMPLSYLRPRKPELESILAESRLTEFQKRDTVEILMRLESEK